MSLKRVCLVLALIVAEEEMILRILHSVFKYAMCEMALH